ncbi:hypothetical protein ATANTOWER_017746 [Ataeniobius toweri]|uniref:Uncharacterized protein n=1 Tax=Ataeniobius toweri TaxID=208326 RepID=A0ABU7C861_9TELE|nr:hypothetical protein [Ataeniobius toweri]
MSMEASHGGMSECSIQCWNAIKPAVSQIPRGRNVLSADLTRCKCTVTIATTVQPLFVSLNWVFVLTVVVFAVHEKQYKHCVPGKTVCRMTEQSCKLFLSHGFIMCFI